MIVKLWEDCEGVELDTKEIIHSTASNKAVPHCNHRYSREGKMHSGQPLPCSTKYLASSFLICILKWKKMFKFSFRKYLILKMMVWVCESVSDTHMFRHARKGEFKRLLPSVSQLLARSERFLYRMLTVKTPSLPTHFTRNLSA